MSIGSDVSRLGGSLARSLRARATARTLDRLPAEVQRDIGWPVSPKPDRAMLFHAIWSAAR